MVSNKKPLIADKSNIVEGKSNLLLASIIITNRKILLFGNY